jgi:hypothetical protein
MRFAGPSPLNLLLEMPLKINKWKAVIGYISNEVYRSLPFSRLFPPF